MRILLTLLTAGLLSSIARADLQIVQDVDSMGQKMTMTMKVKGDMTMIDIPPQMSMILNAQSGEVTNIIHPQKMFMKMNLDAMKGMMEQAAAKKDDLTAKPEVKPTGKKEQINGYETQEYIVTKGAIVSHLWVAKDFPRYQEVKAAFQSLKDGPLGKLNPNMQAEMDLVPGMPLKTVVESNGQPAATVVVKSVSHDPISDATFSVPADYKPFEMPQMPPAPAPATK